MIVQKPFLCIQLVYACVYIGEAGSKRRWFWIKDGDLFKLPASSWKNYVQYLYTVYMLSGYILYIYTHKDCHCFTPISQHSIRSVVWRGQQENPWGFNCPDSKVKRNWSFLSSQQHSWFLGSFFFVLKKNENSKVKWIQVGWSRPQ